MKVKFLVTALGAALFLLFSVNVAQAQDEPPAPYAGMVNPFGWRDASAQGAGKEQYLRSCVGCHGIKGNNLAVSDFSAADFPTRLEKRQDFYFWVLSEGRLSKGMPSYKSSLSEEQRWQVLAYIWSLGTKAPGTPPPPVEPPTETTGGTLNLIVSQQAKAGEPLLLKATIQDKDGKPIVRGTIKFFLKIDFFTNGSMEIGEAVTDGQGTASLEYIPWVTGEVGVVARYGGNETIGTVTMAEASELRYHTEAGLKLPAPGPDILIGPKSALQLGEMGQAPTTAFRLPGGILSWLLLIVVTLALVWFTYFRVIYQVFRIPIVNETREINTRLVPLIGLGIVLFLGIVLVGMLLTGPYSHFHLPR